jgi:hypothetical protein
MIRGAAAQPGKCAFLPGMRKDAQFFRRDAEIEREVWLTSGRLNMNQNPRKQKPQRSKRTPSSACPKPRPVGKKGAEYFP